MRSIIALALALALAGCGRLGFATVEDAVVDAPGDAPSDDAAMANDMAIDAAIGPAYVQRATAISTTGITAVAMLPQPIARGSALVVITLSQQQPVMTIADSLGHTWQLARQVVQGVTGSKLDAWVVCDALAGPDVITVTASFNNGPIHIAAYEIAGAATTACVDQLGQRFEDTAIVDQLVISEGATTGSQVVVAGFGAWFDEVQHTAEAGDLLITTARPDPMGDSLTTVVSPRMPGVQTVRVTADQPTVYVSLLLTIR